MLMILLIPLFATGVFSKYELLEQEFFENDKISTIFDQFIEKYRKKYKPNEYNLRLDIFKENLKNINIYNAESPGMFGVNEFSDLTFDEFSKMYLGFNDFDVTSSDVYDKDKAIQCPKHIDWRDYGYVTPVKSQMRCGSCYAFSAVGQIESLHAKKNKKPAICLSEQQVLDCDKMDSGCHGGLPHRVFNSLINQGGLMRGDEYQYEAQQGDCMLDKSKIAVNVTDSKFFMDIDEEDLKDAVAQNGPVSIGMLFTEKMRHITSGKVYKPDEDCSRGWANHAVLIVGYGRDNDDDYWIIKNSWGTHWGDRGYMRIERGTKACRIGQYAAMAEVQ